ncbi:MAG: hypothetical protein LBQ13_03840 [Endomicrobium sp.]|nr:hypothetical protein [Endomicrobium sp.]
MKKTLNLNLIIILFLIFYSLSNPSFSRNGRAGGAGGADVNTGISNTIGNNIMARNGQQNSGNSNINNSNTNNSKENNENILEILKKNKPIYKPNNDEYHNVFNSFMFSKKNLSIIKKAIVMYDKKITNKNTPEDELEIDKDNEIEYDESMSRVYLKSILYISENQWTVWINNYKLSSSNNNNRNNRNNNSEFIVKNLNSNEAVILWTVEKNKWDLINSEQNIPNTDYNVIDNIVEFEIKLHPNQTFLATENKIIDGKFKQKGIGGIDSAEDDIKQILGNDENFDLESLLN